MHLAMTASVPCACTALRKASRAMTRLYDEALAGSGMTTVQFSILRNLARQGAMPLARLAELLVMDRTSLYRTIAPLEACGWVEVRPANSGKARIAEVSGTGRAAMAAATPAWEAAQRRIVGAFGTENWQTIEGALGRLIALARSEAA